MKTCLACLVGPDDHGQLVAARRAITHLLADRDRVGIDLGADARVAQPRGHVERRSTGSVPGKFATSTGDGRRRRLEPARLVQQGQQPVEADRGTDARQPPRR